MKQILIFNAVFFFKETALNALLGVSRGDVTSNLVFNWR